MPTSTIMETLVMPQKDLYQQGFGTRNEKEYKEKKIVIEKKLIMNTIKMTLFFQSMYFQFNLKALYYNAMKRLDTVIDYAGCSLLWAISLIIGNSLQVKVKMGGMRSSLSFGFL